MAEFPNVPIDVSSEDIENLIKNPIPDEKLELKYWENQNAFSVSSYATLDNLLQSEYDKTKGNSKSIFRIKFTGTFPQYHILGNKEYVAISDSNSNRLIFSSTETGKRYIYKKGEKTIVDINSTGEFWSRKEFSADTYSALDTIINTGSSDYDMFVITLGPDLLDAEMSFEPLIAFIDGKNNGNILMMDMGDGSWWKYQYQSNKITRVNSSSEDTGSKDFIFVSYREDMSSVVSAVTDSTKLYMVLLDVGTISDISVPMDYYLVKRENNTLKFTTVIPNGKVYTYNIENDSLTATSIGDFVELSDFTSLDKFLNYEFESRKMYKFTCVSSEFPDDIGVPQGYYTGYKYGQYEFIFSKIFSEGKVYRLDLDTKTVTVELGYLCNEQFSTMNGLVTYHADIPFLKDKLYLIYFDGEFSSLGLPEGLYQCGYEREVLGVLEYLHATPVNANGKNYVIDIIKGEITSSDIVLDKKLKSNAGADYSRLTIPEAVKALDDKIESAIEYICQVQEECTEVELRVGNIENTLNGLEELLAGI